MIRAYRLYTGLDGNSHVVPGFVNGGPLVGSESIHFKETPLSTFDWHNDPIPQFVITLAGVLEFTTPGEDTFTIRPGGASCRGSHWFGSQMAFAQGRTVETSLRDRQRRRRYTVRTGAA
jgi:hypothetical protein